MPDCEKYMDLISEELDGELSKEEKADLYAHLGQCENCRRYRDALMAVEDALVNDLAEPPASLAKSVMARVNTLPAPGTPVSGKKSNHALWRSLRSASLAAVAVFAIWAGVTVFSPKGAMKAAAPMAAPASMDMAAPESMMEDGAPDLAAGMSRATETAEAEFWDVTPAEAAPMEAPAAEEFMAYAAADAASNCVDVYKGGELLLTTDDPSLWDFVQTQLLTAAEPAEIPAGEPDYALAIFYAGGSVEQVSLWMSGDHIFWQFKGEETAFYSAVSPAQFESHITK